MKKNILILLFIIILTVSCNAQHTENQPNEANFPLSQSMTIQASYDVEKIAIADKWVVVVAPYTLTAVNIATNEKMWTLDGLLFDEDSEPQIINDNLIIATDNEVLVVNKSGQRKSIDLSSKREGVIRLVAIYDNYLYIIRGSDWTLEIYNIAENILMWATWVGRGLTDTYYDSQEEIVYVVTPRAVSAFENMTGKLLWSQQISVSHSAFENNIIYLCEKIDNTDSYRFIAFDVKNQKELWIKEYNTGIGTEIHQVTIIRNLLIVTTKYDHLGIDKNNGDKLWRSNIQDDVFYNSPVEFNGILYAKGSSGKIYAISLVNGSIIGYKLLRNTSQFQSEYDASQNIYRLEDGIAFTTNATILIYK